MPTLELEQVDLQKPELDDDTLEAAWSSWVKLTGWPTRNDMGEFRAFLSKGVHDTDREFLLCKHCEDPAFSDEMSVVRGGDMVCQGCLDDSYSYCEGCERYDTCYDFSGVEFDESRCDSCISNYYTYCENCETYYSDDSDEHDHDSSEDCDCESPVQTFSMRNDGEAPLSADTRVTVTLPAGVIDDAGILRIGYLLREKADTYDWDSDDARKLRRIAYSTLESIGNLWQTKQGNFTKRLSRQAWKDYGYKLDDATMSTIGTIARDHSSSTSEHAIEITRDLNLSAADFGHEGSCWWQSYAYSRCSLKSNGGFGLRSFVGQAGHVSGRAWVQPLKCKSDDFDPSRAMSPTFDTVSPDAFVVYNGYGDMSGYTAARILAHMTGWTYRKIGFSAGNQYVNSGGYLIAPENIASKYDNGTIVLDMGDHSNLHYSETHEN